MVALVCEVRGCHGFSWSPRVGCGLRRSISRLLIRIILRVVFGIAPIRHIVVFGIMNGRMGRRWESNRASVHQKRGRGGRRGRSLPRDPVGCLRSHIRT